MKKSVDEKFKPMLKVKIKSGEIAIDTRKQTYWKIKPVPREWVISPMNNKLDQTGSTSKR